MTFFIFGVMPYIAITVLVVGSIVRYERDPFTWKSSSSQLLRRKQLIWGSVLFHAGILIVFFGHLVGMLTPVELFHALGIGYGFKQLMAIVVGGLAGAVAIAGGAMLLHRRIADPRIRATSSFADTAASFDPPDIWAATAVPYLLSLNASHNGQSLTAP